MIGAIWRKTGMIRSICDQIHLTSASSTPFRQLGGRLQLCFNGKALTLRELDWTLTQPHIIYDWGSTEAPAVTYNVGKLLALTLATLSSKLNQLPHNCFPGNTGLCETEKRRKHSHTKGKKTSPSSSFHFVSAFYLPGHLFPTHTLDKNVSCFASFCHSGCIWGSVQS